MKKSIRIIISTLLISSIFISCKKDEAKASGKDSRDVKYELTGNYSGTFILVATTNNDQAEVIEIKKLPWTLEFTAKASIISLTAITNGNDGKAGETATLKTYLGGKEIMTGAGTALSGGFITMSNPLYIFK